MRPALPARRLESHDASGTGARSQFQAANARSWEGMEDRRRNRLRHRCNSSISNGGADGSVCLPRLRAFISRLPRERSTRPAKTGLLLFCLALAAFPLRAEIVDRIAVSVGNRVITAGDLSLEIRVNAFLDRKPPDLSASAKRASAERMIEQKLIQRELETSLYPVPSAADMEPDFESYKRQGFRDAAAFQAALAEAGLTERNVRDELLWQSVLLAFIEVRFRPGVQVGEQEIKDYFEKTVKPTAEKAHPGAPATLDEYRDRIEITLSGIRVDQDLDQWIKEARARTAVVFHDEALR